MLKSPLFGLSEEQLFELAWDRKGSLRASLRGKAHDRLSPRPNRALDDLAQAARERYAVRFLRACPGAAARAREISRRLGPEANDALDEFLNLALDYETRATPSLQGFLAWLRAAQSEVKRDMEMVRDEVRVMTVHGAKGLEANTVILADTTTPPGRPARSAAVDSCAWRIGVGDRARRRRRRHERRARARRKATRATNTGGCCTWR